MKASCILLTSALILSSLQAQSPLQLNAKLMTAANGVFNMSKEEQRYPMLVVLEQDKLPFPSFWTGAFGEGVVTFQPQEDLLTGDIALNGSGSFTLMLTHSAQQQGMEDKVPAGPWLAATRGKNIRFRFEEFSNARGDGEEGAGDGILYRVKLNVKGKVLADGKESPFNGEAVFFFSSDNSTMRVSANIRFPGAPLGFTGSQAGEIRAHVQSLTRTGIPAPPPRRDATEDMLRDLGF